MVRTAGARESDEELMDQSNQIESVWPKKVFGCARPGVRPSLSLVFVVVVVRKMLLLERLSISHRVTGKPHRQY